MMTVNGIGHDPAPNVDCYMSSVRPQPSDQLVDQLVKSQVTRIPPQRTNYQLSIYGIFIRIIADNE